MGFQEGWEVEAKERMKLPEKCYACCWSWGDVTGEEYCKLMLDPDICEGPKEEE